MAQLKVDGLAHTSQHRKQGESAQRGRRPMSFTILHRRSERGELHLGPYVGDRWRGPREPPRATAANVASAGLWTRLLDECCGERRQATADLPQVQDRLLLPPAHTRFEGERNDPQNAQQQQHAKHDPEPTPYNRHWQAAVQPSPRQCVEQLRSKLRMDGQW